MIQSPGVPDRWAQVYRDQSGALSTLAVVGSPAPDRPGIIASVPNTTSDAPKPDHSGVALVAATLDTIATINGTDAPVGGFWYGTPGSLKPLAVRGDLVPSRTDSTVVIGSTIAFQSDSGLMAFVRQVFTPPATSASELCLLNHGTEQVLLTSADVLTPGETISSFLIIAMNNNGEAVTQVVSKVNGVCCQYSYWLLSPSAPPALIARAASQSLPTCPGFDLLGNLAAASINDDGMVIVKCTLKGVAGTGDGVLGWTRVHGLFPIVLPGDQIEISPGDYKTVWLCQLSSAVAGAPVSTYNCRSINAAGQVPMSIQLLTFTPSYTIVVADFPSLLAAHFPCAAVIDQSPDLIVPQGQPIALDAGVSGANPTTFRWTRDNQDVVDDARTSGATTRHLRISAAAQSDAASYQLHATDSCGTVQSRPISVTILCPADFDSDGTVDFFDYDAFITCFEGGPCPPGKSADFDADGATDFFDYDAFVTAFETPC